MALLRPSELARIWELHPKTVYLWIREGKLRACRYFIEAELPKAIPQLELVASLNDAAATMPEESF